MFGPNCPGPPDPPANLSSMVVTNDVNPVTVMFTWSGLVGENATGIPSNGDSSSLNYTLSIDGTSRSVTTTMEMVEMVNLTSCVSYNTSLSASNKVHMGSPSTVEFNTRESSEFLSVFGNVVTLCLLNCVCPFSAMPVPTVTSDSIENCVSSQTNVTLQCSWNSSSYYVGWYKDGSLIYSEDLSVPLVLKPASARLFVVSDYNDRSSNLTILSSSVADSGSYTCVVSCGARVVSFVDISSELSSSISVSVYGKYVCFDGIWSFVY